MTPRPIGVHYQGDLREALIAAAADALGEHGPERISLRDLARRLGVSHAAPANHFADKTDLLTAVAVRAFRRFTDDLAGVVDFGSQRPDEVLRALAAAYARFAESSPGEFVLMFLPSAIRSDDPDYVEASDAAFANLVAVIEECQRRGWRASQDAQSLAAAAWSLAHGLAVLRSQGSLARHYADTSLGGIATIAGTLIDEPATSESGVRRVVESLTLEELP